MSGLKPSEQPHVALLAKHVPGGLILTTWGQKHHHTDAFHKAAQSRRAILSLATTTQACFRHGERGGAIVYQVDSNTNGVEKSGIGFWGVLHNMHVAGQVRSR